MANKKRSTIIIVILAILAMVLWKPLEKAYNEVFNPEQPFIKVLSKIKPWLHSLLPSTTYDQSKYTDQISSPNPEKCYFIFIKSFYDDVKARRLVNLLRSNNFDSDLRHIVDQNGGNRYEVFVGYFNKYDEAKLNADRIQLELGYWTVIKNDVGNKE